MSRATKTSARLNEKDLTTSFDRRNISLATYQMGSDTAELAVYLARLEDHPSPIWADCAAMTMERLKQSIAEIEAVLDRLPASCRPQTKPATEGAVA